MRLALTTMVVAVTVCTSCGGGGSDSKSSPTTPTVTAVASISLSRDTATLVPLQAVAIVATVRDAQGNLLTGRSITWSSSAPAAQSRGVAGA